MASILPDKVLNGFVTCGNGKTQVLNLLVFCSDFLEQMCDFCGNVRNWKRRGGVSMRMVNVGKGTMGTMGRTDEPSLQNWSRTAAASSPVAMTPMRWPTIQGRRKRREEEMSLGVGEEGRYVSSMYVCM